MISSPSAGLTFFAQKKVSKKCVIEKNSLARPWGICSYYFIC